MDENEDFFDDPHADTLAYFADVLSRDDVTIFVSDCPDAPPYQLRMMNGLGWAQRWPLGNLWHGTPDPDVPVR